VSVVERIRDAELDEISALESLKQRSRSVWEADRGGPALGTDAAELPPEAIRERRVRVAAELLVADVVGRATRRRASSVEVIADPRAQGFYRRLGSGGPGR